MKVAWAPQGIIAQPGLGRHPSAIPCRSKRMPALPPRFEGAARVAGHHPVGPVSGQYVPSYPDLDRERQGGREKHGGERTNPGSR